MRHGKKVNHLGRNSSHRKAMLSNMATSLIMHKRIRTTVAKAKALRKYVEPLITKSKEDSTHSRRVVFSYLQEKNAVTELFREISQKVGNRPGGYTRILRTGYRIGDAAEMCIIELVDYNENYTQNKAGKQLKSKSTRRSKAKKQIENILSANDDNTAIENSQVLEEISTTEDISNTKDVSEQIQDTADAEDKIE